MAEKKEHKIVSASTGASVSKKEAAAKTGKTPVSAQTGNAGGLRAGAVILWIVGLVFEVLAIMLMFEKIAILPKIQPLYKAIGALVLDLICVIIGSQLWKKANHIDPASQKNAFKFWLWNNLGVIVSAIAFIPFIILLLTNKNADKKSKTIGSIIAVVFLAIAGLTSYDWNPLSKEALEEAAKGSQVYWTEHGKKMHLYEDCQALDRSDNLTLGTADEFLAAKNQAGTICKFCEKRQTAAVEAATTEELPTAANE